MRQTIAAARGDLDLVIALESEKRPHLQDTLGIAAQLLEAGRNTEAGLGTSAGAALFC